MKMTDFKVRFNRANILHLIDCYEDSPIYEEVLEEYENMEQEAYAKSIRRRHWNSGGFRRRRQVPPRRRARRLSFLLSL